MNIRYITFFETKVNIKTLNIFMKKNKQTIVMKEILSLYRIADYDTLSIFPYIFCHKNGVI